MIIMGKGWDIFFGIIGVIGALIGLIPALLIGFAALSYAPFSFIILLLLGLLSLASAIYSFKGETWAKVLSSLSFIAILISLYIVFNLVIDLFIIY